MFLRQPLQCQMFGGINSVQIPLKYDENTFEFQKAELKDTLNYSIVDSSNNNIEVLTVNGTKTPLEIILTFKVKETSIVNSYKITLAGVKVGHLDDAEEERMSKSLVVSINEKITDSSNSIIDESTVANSSSVSSSPTVKYIIISVVVLFFVTIIIIIKFFKSKK